MNTFLIIAAVEIVSLIVVALLMKYDSQEYPYADDL